MIYVLRKRFLMAISAVAAAALAAFLASERDEQRAVVTTTLGPVSAEELFLNSEGKISKQRVVTARYANETSARALVIRSTTDDGQAVCSLVLNLSNAPATGSDPRFQSGTFAISELTPLGGQPLLLPSYASSHEDLSSIQFEMDGILDSLHTFWSPSKQRRSLLFLDAAKTRDMYFVSSSGAHIFDYIWSRREMYGNQVHKDGRVTLGNWKNPSAAWPWDFAEVSDILRAVCDKSGQLLIRHYSELTSLPPFELSQTPSSALVPITSTAAEAGLRTVQRLAQIGVQLRSEKKSTQPTFPLAGADGAAGNASRCTLGITGVRCEAEIVAIVEEGPFPGHRMFLFLHLARSLIFSPQHAPKGAEWQATHGISDRLADLYAVTSAADWAEALRHAFLATGVVEFDFLFDEEKIPFDLQLVVDGRYTVWMQRHRTSWFSITYRPAFIEDRAVSRSGIRSNLEVISLLSQATSLEIKFNEDDHGSVRMSLPGIERSMAAVDAAIGYRDAGVQCDISGGLKEALRACEEASALDPASASTIAKIASIHEKLGNKARALLDYRRALAIEPSNRDAMEGVRRLSE